MNYAVISKSGFTVPLVFDTLVEAVAKRDEYNRAMKPQFQDYVAVCLIDVDA